MWSDANEKQNTGWFKNMIFNGPPQSIYSLPKQQIYFIDKMLYFQSNKSILLQVFILPDQEIYFIVNFFKCQTNKSISLVSCYSSIPTNLFCSFGTCTWSGLRKPDISVTCWPALFILFIMEGVGDLQVGGEEGSGLFRTGDITVFSENTGVAI